MRLHHILEHHNEFAPIAVKEDCGNTRQENVPKCPWRLQPLPLCADLRGVATLCTLKRLHKHIDCSP